MLQTLGRGQIFGEMALLSPRPADVVAITDVELMMLRQEFVENLLASAPATGGRMAWNLAVLLCDHLNATTSFLLALTKAA